MKLETRFNLGDTVLVVREAKVYPCRVIGIDAHASRETTGSLFTRTTYDLETTQSFEYRVTNGFGRHHYHYTDVPEEKVYSTREEMAQKL